MSGSVTDANRQPDSGDGTRGVARALGVALALWIAGPVVGNLLGAIPVVAVIAAEGGLPEVLPAWATLSGQVLLDGTFLLVGAVYAKRWLGGLDASLPADRDWRWIAAGLGGAVAMWGLSTALSTVLSVEPPTSTLETTFGEPWAFAAFAVLGVVLVPVAEEVLFRGAIQRRLRRSLGRWPAIAIASVGFLSVHLLNYVGGSALALAIAFGTLFAVSTVIGYVYERAETLAVPIAAHVVYNAVQFGLMFAGVIG